MSNIQIVTDSTAYITKEFIDMTQVKIAPLNVHFENEVFEEGFPGEFDTFYERLKVSKDFPKTSQPSTDTFKKIFEDALEEGKEVIAIVISSELSGTFNSAYAAAQMTNPERISLVDSESVASNLRVLVERAFEMAQEGHSREEIVNCLNNEKHQMSINLTVDSLEYLKRGGRLSHSKAMVATVLDIRPILAVINGKLEAIEKVRGRKKSIEMMLENIPQNVKQLSVCHTVNYEEASQVKKIIEKTFSQTKICIDEIGPVVGSHLGPIAIGICYTW